MRMVGVKYITSLTITTTRKGHQNTIKQASWIATTIIRKPLVGPSLSRACAGTSSWGHSSTIIKGISVLVRIIMTSPSVAFISRRFAFRNGRRTGRRCVRRISAVRSMTWSRLTIRRIRCWSARVIWRCVMGRIDLSTDGTCRCTERVVRSGRIKELAVESKCDTGE
jgi:hypothetical protein